MRPTPKIANMHWPNQGAKAITYNLNFANYASISEDMAEELMSQGIEFVQSVFIDNSLNASEFTLSTLLGDSTVGIVAQANSQGWYPFVADTGATRFTAKSAGGVMVTLAFVNVAMPYFTWGPISATATFATPQGVFADRTKTLVAGGTSQQLMAANGARKRFMIVNGVTGADQGIAAAEEVQVNFTATASVGGTSIVLSPGGSFDSGSGPVSTEAINFLAATTGHILNAKEM